MPDPRQTVWTWEMTPAEMLGGFRFIQARRVTVTMEPTPFSGVPVVPFPDMPGLTLQVALGRRSVSDDIQQLLSAQPELPVVNERRSGIIALRDGVVVGSLAVAGFKYNDSRSLVVAKQGQGLGRALLVEWGWRVKRVRVLALQGITVASARALMGAHRIVIERALSHGLPVPQRAIEATRDGNEARQIIADAEAVDKIGLVVESRSQEAEHG